jgi:hypothetical protein
MLNIADSLAESGGFEPSRPFISHMLPRSHAHFLLRGRILSIIFFGVWEPCQRHPVLGMAQAIGRFENERCGSTGKLQFHHLDKSTELFRVFSQQLCIEESIAEAEKCEMLCRSCHMKRDDNERKGIRPRRWELKHLSLHRNVCPGITSSLRSLPAKYCRRQNPRCHPRCSSNQLNLF